ncbi:hypothetical protein O1L60_36630 [Streptomyces diastatochromogenes]|nr:hypothetical protein [Streptomyces diastatochromogenes]
MADLAGSAAEPLDLSAESDALDHGAWLEPGIEDRLAAELLDRGAAAVTTAYAQPRLSASAVLSATSRRPSPPASTSGSARPPSSGPRTTARSSTRHPAAPPHLRPRLLLDLSWNDADTPCPPAGTPLRAGDRLAALPSRTRLRLTLRHGSGPEVPALVRPEYAAGWLALTADPAPLVGAPAADTRPGRTCSPGARPRSPRCRSTTTATRPGSNAVGATTWPPPTAAPTSTWSTTSPRWATRTPASSGPWHASCAG